MTILLTILFGLVVVSLLEYFGHRSALHSGFTSLGKDHITHHKYFARDYEATGEKVAFYDLYCVRAVFGFLWTLPFTLLLTAFVSWDSGLTMALVGIGHALLWQFVHNQMHRPTIGVVVRTGWFKYMNRFHLGHHQKSLTNYAFIFAPIWDKVFGTYRRTEDGGQSGRSNCESGTGEGSSTGDH